MDNEIDRMHSEFSNEVRNTSQDINNLKSDLLMRIVIIDISTDTEIGRKEMQLTEGGIFYRENFASFSNVPSNYDGEQSYIANSDGEKGILYPIW